MSAVRAQLLTPRWTALTLTCVAVLVAFGLLSHWQWDRANRDQDAAAAATTRPPVAAGTVLTGSPLDPAAYGTAVEATGVYDPAGQRLVVRDDRFWVVTPLVTGSGPVIPVVRGAVMSDSATPPPPGRVTVVGMAEPYDGDPGPQPGDSALPAGQLARLTPSALRGAVAGELAGGWVALSSQRPASVLAPVVPPSSGDTGAHIYWQNATYAVQWLLFAGFVAFLWWRWFRDELRAADAVDPAPLPDDQVAGTGT